MDLQQTCRLRLVDSLFLCGFRPFLPFCESLFVPEYAIALQSDSRQCFFHVNDAIAHLLLDVLHPAKNGINFVEVFIVA